MAPKVIFIIPYRARASEMIHFTVYYRYLMQDWKKEDWAMYFSHQLDSRPFNRGGTKNIGFIAMRDLYPNDYKNITFVFHDIDTLPVVKNQFNYLTTTGTIKHFYGFDFALGGIISITGSDFEKLGGFPNYWDWGLEDNDLQHRAIQHGIHMDRTQMVPFQDKRILQINNRHSRNISAEKIWRAGPNNREGWHTIQNLKYTVDHDNNMINITSFTTGIDPARDHYYSQKLDGRIRADPRFRPADAINSVSQLKGVGVNFNNTRRRTKTGVNFSLGF